jgi:uncharacterized protein HemY
MHHLIAKILIALGSVLLLAGILIYFGADKWFTWFGHLPGDIRIERENFRFYFPITTMVIISLIVTLVIRIIGRFMH